MRLHLPRLARLPSLALLPSAARLPRPALLLLGALLLPPARLLAAGTASSGPSSGASSAASWNALGLHLRLNLASARLTSSACRVAMRRSRAASFCSRGTTDCASLSWASRSEALRSRGAFVLDAFGRLLRRVLQTRHLTLRLSSSHSLPSPPRPTVARRAPCPAWQCSAPLHVLLHRLVGTSRAGANGGVEGVWGEYPVVGVRRACSPVRTGTGGCGCGGPTAASASAVLTPSFSCTSSSPASLMLRAVPPSAPRVAAALSA